MIRRGRFGRAMDPLASEFTSSMEFDAKIFRSVVLINIAHTIMLTEREIISKRDASKILRALQRLHRQGITTLELRPELEDIHMAIEKFVIEATSEEIGGKLNTAKSRNDQVATAIRMTLHGNLLEVEEAMIELITALLTLAKKNVDVVMPGYTHLQVAQPTTFSHYLAAYAFSFLRDIKRLEQACEGADSCPMGSCALSGTGFPIDRMRTANLLGFKRIDENTLDAVGSRDFVLQAMGSLAFAIVNLSRLAEEIVLWSSAEFGMIELPEEFAATSSIMPQKKNPVVAELVRAKAARVLGDLSGALALIKALPQSYNLDLQELTSLLWDSIDAVKDSVTVMAKLIGTVKPKREVMRKRAEQGFATATELADTLVRKTGLSFRDAHAIVGRMIARTTAEGCAWRELNVEDIRAASREILGKEIQLSPQNLKGALDLDGCIAARSLPGGPAPREVMRQLKSLEQTVKNHLKLLQARKRTIERVERELLKEVKRLSR